METETRTMPPKAPRLTPEKDALPSQVLEIIGGITLEALQSLEDPEVIDVWSMEEGDDSVFYSDEDRAHQEIKANISCGFGANDCERLVNSVADEDDTGDEFIMEEEITELETEGTQQVIMTEQEEQRQELQEPKAVPMDHSDPAAPGARPNPIAEKSASACGESLNCIITDMQTQQNIPAEKVTPNLEPFNEERHTRLSRQADVPQQHSSAELQMSGDRSLQVEQDQNFSVPVGFHQNSGFSTLPLPKKSSFPSKYDTVSYRKIRRGNTRQKIEEFEYMIMNL